MDQGGVDPDGHGGGEPATVAELESAPAAVTETPASRGMDPPAAAREAAGVEVEPVVQKAGEDGPSGSGHQNPETAEELFALPNFRLDYNAEGDEEPPGEFYDPGTEEELGGAADPEYEADEDLAVFTGREAPAFQRAVREHELSILGATMPKLPWETGIYAEIFGNVQNSVIPSNDFWMPVPAEPLRPLDMPASGSRDGGATGSLPSGMPTFARHV
eukprot:s2664_g18.t1